MSPFQFCLLIAVCLVWAFHVIVIKTTVDLVSPLTYVAWRMVILAAVLSPLLKWHRGQMRLMIAGGACFGGLNYVFMFSGLKLTTASIGAILMESYVIIATIFSVLFLGEKVGWRRISGIASALIGITIIATAEGDATGSANLPLGAFFILIGMTAEASGALAVKKIHGVKPLAMLAWFALVGCVITVLLALIFEREHFAWTATPDRGVILGALGYSVVAASIFGHSTYYYLLQRVPLSLIAPSGLLITFFAVIFGVTLLGEPLTPRLLVGGALVVSGVGVVLIRANPPDRKQVIAAAAADAESREKSYDRSDVAQPRRPERNGSLHPGASLHGHEDERGSS